MILSVPKKRFIGLTALTLWGFLGWDARAFYPLDPTAFYVPALVIYFTAGFVLMWIITGEPKI